MTTAATWGEERNKTKKSKRLFSPCSTKISGIKTARTIRAGFGGKKKTHSGKREKIV